MNNWYKTDKEKKFLSKFFNFLTKSTLNHFPIIKKTIYSFLLGNKISNDPSFQYAKEKSLIEIKSKYKRTDVINKILSSKKNNTQYLEIGVRNPEENFNLINSKFKYSVDPGYETQVNKADFKLTSDEFFQDLSEGKIFSSKFLFDVIFIDGLHLAEQVEKDINNSLKFLKEDGFIILHDVNPPTEWHARESYSFFNSPAGPDWNGTVWKSFLNKRFDKKLNSCCIDVDWGVGIISKTHNIGNSIERENHFFEYKDFDKNRRKYLNLVSFDEFFRLI